MNQSIIDFSDPAAVARFCNDVRKLQGKWRVEMKRYRARRSDKQNAAMWGMVVPVFADWITENWGQPCSPDDAFEILKRAVIPKTFTDPVTGKSITIGGSSSKLTTEEFSLFFEGARELVTRLTGIEIPDPDPLHHLNH